MSFVTHAANTLQYTKIKKIADPREKLLYIFFTYSWPPPRKQFKRLDPNMAKRALKLDNLFQQAVG
jgi:hypothetical protein